MAAGYKRPEDFAPLVSRSWRSVRDYENERTEIPSSVLQQWAAATKQPLEYFFEKPEPAREEVSTVIHRGVEELAADPALVERLGLNMAAVEAARHFVALGSDGQPVEIDNLTDAVEIVRVLQRSLQRREAGGE